jgi:hypothetical protein
LVAGTGFECESKLKAVELSDASNYSVSKSSVDEAALVKKLSDSHNSQARWLPAYCSPPQQSEASVSQA